MKIVYDFFLRNILNICPKCHSRYVHHQTIILGCIVIRSKKYCPNCDKEKLESLINNLSKKQ